MKRILAFVLLTFFYFQASPAAAQLESCLPAFCQTTAPPATCTEATVFLARTSGLDGTHTNAYTNLICGLVTDGIWTKLDVLYTFATQNTTTAQLNLKSTSFSAVLHGAPVFTTDRGYLGVDNSSTVYIDTQVSGTMSPGLNYTAFESHISAWSNTNFQTVSSGGVVMGVHCSTCDFTLLAPWQNSDALFANVGTISTSAVSDSLGFYVANRCCVGNVGGTFTAYKNTTQVINVSNTVGTLYSGPIVILAYNDANLTGGPGPISGGAYQISAATIGGSLDVTQEGNLHARLRTYLTAVGVP